MDMRLIVCVVAATLAIMALPALAAPDHAILAKRLNTEIAVPGYNAFSRQAYELAGTVESYCANGDASIEDVALSFHDAMDTWQRVQHIRHGPVMDINRHSRIQFWPDKRDKTGKHLRKLLANGINSDLEPVTFANKSVAIQGFHALERLIFDKPNLEPQVGRGKTVTTCATAIAITMNIAQIATEIFDPSSSTNDSTKSVRSYVMDLTTGFEVISRLKLGMPNGTRQRPKLAENWRSERSLRNIRINMRSLKQQYLILAGTGFRNDPSHHLILRQFKVIETQLSEFTDAMSPALDQETGPARLRAIALTINDLRELVIIKLTEHLDINLGFNSLDGD